ncbi:MAG: hypothetical protein R3B84_15730 [Zavarzinella sp.]
MFARIIKKIDGENVERIVNLNQIQFIDVGYFTVNESGQKFDVGYDQGKDDPDCRRIYTLTIGGEQINLISNPNSKVVQAIEKIYREALTD